MARTLKVWGGCFDGTTQTIVAAANRKEAAAAFGVSLYTLDEWSSVTGNEHDIATAMSKPGVVFSSPMSGPHQDVFAEGRHRYIRGASWPPA